KRLLLNAIGGNGTDLREHILTGIEDTCIGAQCGLAVAKNVPGETEARLEHFVLVGNFSGRRKIGIAEIWRVRRLRRGNDWVRKPLCLPAKTIVNSQIAGDLPGILSEKGELVIDDGRETGLIEAFA